MPTIEQLQEFGQTRADAKGGNAQRELMVERIIKEIEEGVAPWMKPWSADVLSVMQPHNGASGHSYRGVNAFWLWILQQSMGTIDGRWMTFKQARDKGYSVKKGHKGAQVIYASSYQIKDEETGEPILDERTGLPIFRSFAKVATVFHASDIDGIEELKHPAPVDREPLIESLIANSHVRLSESARPEAYYIPAFDSMHMPLREAFADNPAGYTSTILHEFSHWTGHKSRLDRFADDLPRFGSVEYAKEELIAEMSAFFTASELGLDYAPGNTAAYLDSWSKTVAKSEQREQSKIIRDAMFQAGKASEMLVALAREEAQVNEKAA